MPAVRILGGAKGLYLIYKTRSVGRYSRYADNVYIDVKTPGIQKTPSTAILL